MDSYPLAKVKFLKLRQASGFDAASWNNPTETLSGLHVHGRAGAAYDRNAEELIDVLRTELRGEPLVFTHNPWGEYGHEEHVQVFKVLTRLRDSLVFELFVSSYVSNRSAKLMTQSLHRISDDFVTRETDKALARQLKALYTKHDCWTWADDYQWPVHETFYRISEPVDTAQSGSSASPPLNYITRHYSLNPMRKLAKRLLPESVVAYIKKNL